MIPFAWPNLFDLICCASKTHSTERLGCVQVRYRSPFLNLENADVEYRDASRDDEVAVRED